MSGSTAYDEHAPASAPRSVRRDVANPPHPHGPCQCPLDAHPGGCHGPAAWDVGEPHDRHNVCSYCTGPDDIRGAVLLVEPGEPLDAYDAYDALGAHIMRRRAARAAALAEARAEVARG